MLRFLFVMRLLIPPSLLSNMAIGIRIVLTDPPNLFLDLLSPLLLVLDSLMVVTELFLVEPLLLSPFFLDLVLAIGLILVLGGRLRLRL